MEEYLSSRRSEDQSSDKGFFDSFKEKIQNMRLKKQETHEVALEEDYEVEEQAQEDYIEDEPVSTPKRSLISWLFRRKQRVYEEDWEEDEVEVQEPSLQEQELREAIKILHKWIEKLDPDTLNKFKRSEDFEKYKSILKSLNMIK